MDAKKRREQFLLECFLKASGMAAEIVEQREAPDFIVRFEERFVGVEVTELFVSHDANSGLPQAHESISSGIVSRAQQMYIAAGSRPVHVSLCFGPRSDLRGVDRHAFAAQLCAFVQDLNLDDGQRFVWRPGAAGGSLPAAVSYLQALGVPKHVGRWVVARAGWVAPLTGEALQSRVDDKSVRLRAYKDSIGENWLVIVADGTKPSQLFEVREGFDPRTVSSPFSRTFFYGYPDRATIELGVAVR